MSSIIPDSKSLSGAGSSVGRQNFFKRVLSRLKVPGRVSPRLSEALVIHDIPTATANPWDRPE